MPCLSIFFTRLIFLTRNSPFFFVKISYNEKNITIFYEVRHIVFMGENKIFWKRATKIHERIFNIRIKPHEQILEKSTKFHERIFNILY